MGACGMQTVAIIQARLGSTRLPGKVLLDLAGRPMLERVVSRVRRAGTIDRVLVATTVEDRDRPLVEMCDELGVDVWRGSENDVLDRYRGAAAATGAGTVVRITSDCPFIDPGVIDRVVGAFRAAAPAVDYASNIAPVRCWPRGLDTEVFSFAALDRAWREDRDPALREHVTPYIYRHPETFRLLNVTMDADASVHRWTVDTPEDFALAAAVYDRFGHDRFSWREALDLVEREPALSALNAHVEQKVLV
jgi:spore coat polysaccharide biosynthesis protein SpsF